MKKVLALVLMAMLVLSAAAFAEEDGWYIGYSNQQRSEDFFITVGDGLAAAAAEHGIQFEESITDRDAVKMTQVVDTYILKGVDMVIDFNVLAETGAEMAAKLSAEGIPMISIDCVYDGAYFFGVNNYDAGVVLGTAAIDVVNEKFGGELEYVVVLYDSSAGADVQARVDGAAEVLAEEFSVPAENVVYLDCMADDTKTTSLTRDWLNSHPDASKIVFIGQNDDRGYAINNVVNSDQRVEDSIIISHNADPSAIENLQAHPDGDTAWLLTASYNSHLYGEQVIDMAMKILNGEEVDDQVYAKVTVVGLDNLDEYLASIEG